METIVVLVVVVAVASSVLLEEGNQSPRLREDAIQEEKEEIRQFNADIIDAVQNYLNSADDDDDDDGVEILYPLQGRGRHRKYGLSTEEGTGHVNHAHFLLPVGGSRLRLRLELNRRLFAANFAVASDKRPANCYYHGTVKSQDASLSESEVAISTCHGLSGVIHLRNGTVLSVLPLRGVTSGVSGVSGALKFPHLFYDVEARHSSDRCGNAPSKESREFSSSLIRRRSLVDHNPSFRPITTKNPLQRRRRRRLERRRKRRRLIEFDSRIKTGGNWRKEREEDPENHGEKEEREEKEKHNFREKNRRRRDAEEKENRLRVAVFCHESLFSSSSSSSSSSSPSSLPPLDETRLFDVFNLVDLWTKKLRLRLRLVHFEIWKEEKGVIAPTIRETLQNFLTLKRQSAGLPYHDAAILLTSSLFREGRTTVAVPDSICSSRCASVVVVDAVAVNLVDVAARIAHAFGHNLGLRHDEADCSCSSLSSSTLSPFSASSSPSSCLMSPDLFSPVAAPAAAAAASPLPFQVFSNCSRVAMRKLLQRGKAVCLRDVSTSLPLHVCGNGVVEGVEECDCGSASSCSSRDKCCDPLTCRLKAGAQCSVGPCCHDCLLRPASFACRTPKTECDTPEFCDGIVGECPENDYLQNGSPCRRGEGICFNGACATHNDQCQTIWGRGSRSAEEGCYATFNTEGSVMGHCGRANASVNGATVGASGAFKVCAKEDVDCGLLHCQRGTQSPILYEELSYIRSIVHANGRDFECKVLTPAQERLSAGAVGLVSDGARCGAASVCWRQTCVGVARFVDKNCPIGRNGRICSGHGACTAKGNCLCFREWLSRDCSVRDATASTSSTPLPGDAVFSNQDSRFGGSTNGRPMVEEEAEEGGVPSFDVTEEDQRVGDGSDDDNSDESVATILVVFGAVVGGGLVALAASAALCRRKTPTTVATFSSPYFGAKKKQIGVVKATVKSGAVDDRRRETALGSADAASDKDGAIISFGSMPSYRGDKRQPRATDPRDRSSATGSGSASPSPPTTPIERRRRGEEMTRDGDAGGSVDAGRSESEASTSVRGILRKPGQPRRPRGDGRSGQSASGSKSGQSGGDSDIYSGNEFNDIEIEPRTLKALFSSATDSRDESGFDDGDDAILEMAMHQSPADFFSSRPQPLPPACLTASPSPPTSAFHPPGSRYPDDVEGYERITDVVGTTGEEEESFRPIGDGVGDGFQPIRGSRSSLDASDVASIHSVSTMPIYERFNPAHRCQAALLAKQTPSPLNTSLKDLSPGESLEVPEGMLRLRNLQDLLRDIDQTTPTSTATPMTTSMSSCRRHFDAGDAASSADFSETEADFHDRSATRSSSLRRADDGRLGSTSPRDASYDKIADVLAVLQSPSHTYARIPEPVHSPLSSSAPRIYDRRPGLSDPSRAPGLRSPSTPRSPVGSPAQWSPYAAHQPLPRGRPPARHRAAVSTLPSSGYYGSGQGAFVGHGHISGHASLGRAPSDGDIVDRYSASPSSGRRGGAGYAGSDTESTTQGYEMNGNEGGGGGKGSTWGHHHPPQIHSHPQPPRSWDANSARARSGEENSPIAKRRPVGAGAVLSSGGGSGSSGAASPTFHRGPRTPSAARKNYQVPPDDPTAQYPRSPSLHHSPLPSPFLHSPLGSPFPHPFPASSPPPLSPTPSRGHGAFFPRGGAGTTPTSPMAPLSPLASVAPRQHRATPPPNRQVAPQRRAAAQQIPVIEFGGGGGGRGSMERATLETNGYKATTPTTLSYRLPAPNPDAGRMKPQITAPLTDAGSVLSTLEKDAEPIVAGPDANDAADETRRRWHDDAGDRRSANEVEDDENSAATTTTTTTTTRTSPSTSVESFA